MKIIIPYNEINFSVMRSSGAGGQHVNKTNSAVQLRFRISDSLVLTDHQKELIYTKLCNRINSEGELLIRSEDSRDQKSNKESAYRTLNFILNKAIAIPKKRIPTKIKRSAVETRIKTKKIKGEIKSNRSKKIHWD